MECARLAPGMDQSMISLNCKLDIVETIKYISKLELKGYIKREGTCIYLI